ncbi:hypothetical protein SAMN04515647_4389 [Cohaesibacter sp. ES.047]|uniref:hypothetical protein n=1 Tax=Cohaesibacter sp. ES.047 TaxID=1798205 RepID=UPI000BB7EA1C|nr:hypothetical protein [Cohaesibacter sp. ES.047]SNY94065.1 hypothetical protein SAMN04515647_4389 [Cohaesibacter sp. ES.047]
MIEVLDPFDEVAEVADGEFSELLRIMPQKNAMADTDRLAFDLMACLRVGEVGDEAIGNGRSWSGRIQSGKARLVIARSSYLGPALKEGDLVRAKSRIGEPVWEIMTIDDRNLTRIICELGAAR